MRFFPWTFQNWSQNHKDRKVKLKTKIPRNSYITAGYLIQYNAKL